MAEGTARTSADWATRNGITALQSAQEGVKRCLTDVENTRTGLNTGYQGSDGRAYSDLLAEWEVQVGKILGNLEEMITNLQTNATEVAKNQHAANEAIRNVRAKGHAAYSTLMGS
ncbi:WXG100 family type VII secretion target [Streptomyces viridiviolaceus]